MRELAYYLEKDQVLTEEERQELELTVADLAGSGHSSVHLDLSQKEETLIRVMGVLEDGEEVPRSWIVSFEFHHIEPMGYLSPPPEMILMKDKQAFFPEIPENRWFGKPPRILGCRKHQVRRLPVSRRTEAGWCR